MVSLLDAGVHRDDGSVVIIPVESHLRDLSRRESWRESCLSQIPKDAVMLFGLQYPRRLVVLGRVDPEDHAEPALAGGDGIHGGHVDVLVGEP